jgi:hypothetical protein
MLSAIQSMECGHGGDEFYSKLCGDLCVSQVSDLILTNLFQKTTAVTTLHLYSQRVMQETTFMLQRE